MVMTCLEWDTYTGTKGYISKTQCWNGNHIADFLTVLAFIFWDTETNDGYSGEKPEFPTVLINDDPLPSSHM